MSIPTKLWLYLCAVILACASVWYHGYHTADAAWMQRDTDRKLDDATTANQAWAERFALQAQLATRDQQLANAQQTSSKVRTETIIKREVIYLDKIKTVAVRDCVADSGLLDVYDATLGLSGSAEWPNDTARCADGYRRQSGSSSYGDEAQRRCTAK